MRMFEITGDVEIIINTTISGFDRIEAERKAREMLDMFQARVRDLSPHLIERQDVRVGVVKERKEKGINLTIEKRVVINRLKKIVKKNLVSFPDFVKGSSRRIKNDLMVGLLIFREGEMNQGSEISFEKGFQRAGSRTRKLQFLEFADLFGAVAARTDDIKIEEDIIYGGVKFVLKETIGLMLKCVNTYA